MRTGQLKQRVEWQRATTTNVSGQIKPTFSSNGTYWASVEPLSGREGIVARMNRADVTHMVKCWNFGDVQPKDHLIYKTRTLEVVSVLNTNELDVRSSELNIICIEVIDK